MSKNKIDVRLVFQGADDDPKMIVGKWANDNKQLAIEALTMLCQVRELILSGGHTPERIKLATLESVNFLQARLQLIEQLGEQLGSGTGSEPIDRSHHRQIADDIDIEL